MGPLDVVTIRGVPMTLHPVPDYVSDHIRRTRDFYEIAILEEIRRRLATMPPGVIVDAGAMIGNHTAYIASFVPHTDIHAFEPAPANVVLLLDNVAAMPRVMVHQIALSDRARVVEMAVDPANLGHGVITETDVWPVDYPSTFYVETRTLDSYELHDVRLIKIDVEWHEPQVLAGARETIDRCHPLIVIEDWRHHYGALLPGYRMVAEWERAHQTFMYEWVGD